MVRLAVDQSKPCREGGTVLGGDTVSQDWRPLTHVRAAGSLGARTPRNGTAWWHVRTLALIHDTQREIGVGLG